MAWTLYKTKEGEVAPEVPSFLRGKFFELYDKKKPTNEQAIGWGAEYETDEYVGWIHFRNDGTIEFGEPGV